MRDFLLAYRVGIGFVLSMIAATLTVIVFQASFGLAWYIAVPAGVLAYVTALVLWNRLLAFYVH